MLKGTLRRKRHSYEVIREVNPMIIVRA